MVKNPTIIIVADHASSVKLFSDRLRARGRLPKETRFVFTDSERAQSVFEAESARGDLRGAFLDISAKSAVSRKILFERYRELVCLCREAAWVITHEASVDPLNAGSKIFGPNSESRWNALQRPFSRAALLHQVLRMLQTSAARGGAPDSLSGRKARIVERAERLALLGQLSRGIGHEFGNILLKISGRAELASVEVDPVKVGQHLAVIASSAERAGLIVRNLQTLSKTLICPEPVAPAGILEEALLQTLHVSKSRRLKVVKHYGAVPMALLDKRSIAQVLSNIILNAIEAMPNGGRLELRVVREKSEGSQVPLIAISVEDTGGGIPEDVLPRIFDFAFTTKGDMGTGLGLSVSKQVVEAHGGEILVQSTPGQGTRVTVLVPAVET